MRTLLTLALLAATLPSLPAASITLVSQSGGTFTYNLRIEPLENVTFGFGQIIELSGLSGVTSATASSPLGIYFTPSFTPTSVTLTQTLVRSGITLANRVNEVLTFDSLLVTSTATTIGPVNYAINANFGAGTGQVLGPVEDTPPPGEVPEPGTYTLMAAGLVALVARCWRR